MHNSFSPQHIWESKEYYKKAQRGSSDLEHPGMKILKKLAVNATSVLDLGCGEGTRLHNLVTKGRKAIGIDISKTAIKLAKNKYPWLQFIRANLEELPSGDGSFDLVYSAYVLEHLRGPEKVLNEAFRVLKPKGLLVLIAPNYGAPNRAAPLQHGSRWIKLISGFLFDFVHPFADKQSLYWHKVTPMSVTSSYKMDHDATVEPYLLTLIYFLKRKGMTIKKYSSCWDQELPGANIMQKCLRMLGEIGIYPFNYWGPHLVVVAKKIA